MEALIALGVDSANQAYRNSQIAMQLQLVHTAEVAYTESGTIDTDLTRLRSTTDGFMDQVHPLRDQYKADLVALIVDNGGNSCGIAYVMTNGPHANFASSAFSVTAYDCIVNDTLAHEMGHNMGNAYDRATGGTGAFAYSYGYRDVLGRFRTILRLPDRLLPAREVFLEPDHHDQWPASRDRSRHRSDTLRGQRAVHERSASNRRRMAHRKPGHGPSCCTEKLASDHSLTRRM